MCIETHWSITTGVWQAYVHTNLSGPSFTSGDNFVKLLSICRNCSNTFLAFTRINVQHFDVYQTLAKYYSVNSSECDVIHFHDCFAFEFICTHRTKTLTAQQITTQFGPVDICIGRTTDIFNDEIPNDLFYKLLMDNISTKFAT